MLQQRSWALGMRTGSCGRRAGFTLLECVAIMLLLAVLAVVAVVRESGIVGVARTRGAEQMLAQNLAYARARAMSTTNTWTLAYGATVVLTRDGAPVALPDPSSETPPAGVSISAGAVTFDRYGAPDAPQAITVTDGAYARVITVWAETGLIE